jgi:hypothetical protein
MAWFSTKVRILDCVDQDFRILVNRVTRAFTEASYPTELVLSVGKSGLNQELIERNFKLGSRWRTRFSAIWLGKEIVIC